MFCTRKGIDSAVHKTLNICTSGDFSTDLHLKDLNKPINTVYILTTANYGMGSVSLRLPSRRHSVEAEEVLGKSSEDKVNESW